MPLGYGVNSNFYWGGEPVTEEEYYRLSGQPRPASSGGLNLFNNSGFNTATSPTKLAVTTNPYAPMSTADAMKVNPNNLSTPQQAALAGTALQNEATKAGISYGSGKGGAVSFGVAAPGASGTVGNPAPASPSPVASSATAKAVTSPYDEEILKLERAKQAQRDAAIGKINSMANPYDTNSDAFKGALAGAVNRTNRAMAGSEARANGALAGRGMLGSGYAAAAAANLASARGMGVSDTMNGMFANALQQGARFGLDQQSAILNALSGRDITDTLADLQRKATDNDRFNIGRQDMSDNERNQVIALIAKLGVENAPAILKALGVA